MAAKLYQESVAAANRRDVPSVTQVTGSLVASAAWDSSGNRKGYARFDSGSELAYYEIEATSPTQMTLRAKTKLGDDTETTGITVAAGGSYTTIIPGVTITFAGSITTGHKSRIWAASYLLASNSIFTPRGAAGDWQSWYYENADAFDHFLTKVVAARGTDFENTSGSAIAGFNRTVPNPTATTYAVTVANGSVSGKKFTFTPTSGAPVEVDNVAAGSTNNAIGSTGLTFNAGAAPANTDTANCYVYDMADVIEICPDNAGSPNVAAKVIWNASTGVVFPVNRVGFTDQLIPAGQTVRFWVRTNPGASHTLGRSNARLYPDYQQAQ